MLIITNGREYNMKTIIITLLLSFISLFDQVINISSDVSTLNIQVNTNSCPTSHEKAEEELKNYLDLESNIKDLNLNYNLNINHTAIDSIVVLNDEMNSGICKKIINYNMQWLENAPDFSIYKVGENYFAVTYTLIEKGEIERHSIVVINSELEAVAVVLDL